MRSKTSVGTSVVNAGRAGREDLIKHYEPDVLAKGLQVVFCGINPASTAVTAGHNFASASNRFWRVIHLAGFTPEQIAPQDERQLLQYHCGITAVVTRATARASEVPYAEFRQARAAFDAKMQQYSPRCLAFLGKRALAAMMGEPKIAWGLQTLRLASAMVWVLPNPSGLNRGFPLAALARSYAELHGALISGLEGRIDADRRSTYGAQNPA